MLLKEPQNLTMCARQHRDRLFSKNIQPWPESTNEKSPSRHLVLAVMDQ